MSILYLQEHERCSGFDHRKEPMIEVMRTAKGCGEEIELSHSEIIFLLDGKLDFIFGEHPRKSIHKGQFFFVPAARLFRYKAKDECRMVIIRMNKRIRLCPSMVIEQLFEKKEPQDKQKNPETIFILNMNTHLWYFLTGLSAVLADGFKCRHYFENKTHELFFLLRAFYSKEQLAGFFSLVLSPDTAFSEYVRSNVLKYRTVKEFATSLNITPKQFTRKFNHVFKQTPYAWMKQEKVQMIRREMEQTEKSNKQIAFEYGFSTPSQLYDFCKENLGKTPGEIRKNHKIRRNSDTNVPNSDYLIKN